MHQRPVEAFFETIVDVTGNEDAACMVTQTCIDKMRVGSEAARVARAHKRTLKPLFRRAMADGSGRGEECCDDLNAASRLLCMALPGL